MEEEGSFEVDKTPSTGVAFAFGIFEAPGHSKTVWVSSSIKSCIFLLCTSAEQRESRGEHETDEDWLKSVCHCESFGAPTSCHTNFLGTVLFCLLSLCCGLESSDQPQFYHISRCSGMKPPSRGAIPRTSCGQISVRFLTTYVLVTAFDLLFVLPTTLSSSFLRISAKAQDLDFLAPHDHFLAKQPNPTVLASWRCHLLANLATSSLNILRLQHTMTVDTRA